MPGFKIYVYEIPPELGFTYGRSLSRIYQAERFFLNRLLVDSAVRTLEPADADLFLVPFFSVYGPSANRFNDASRLLLVRHWLQTHHPRLWARYDGRDHVFFLSGDRGACGLERIGAKPIFVTHWGLLGPWTLMRSIAHTGKSAAARTRAATAAALSTAAFCHSPHKDVVVPPYIDSLPSAKESVSTRRHRLVHAGGICGWGDGCAGLQHTWGGQLNRTAHAAASPPAKLPQPPSRRHQYGNGYSLGMRQRIYAAWGGKRGATAGIVMYNHSLRGRGAWAGLMRASDWCLAVAGDGWGTRLSESILAGCLPLIAQPSVMQPFEDALQYDSFAARIEPEEVGQLPTWLRDAAPTVTPRRAHLATVRRAFSWGKHGLAYNMTVLSLCHRAVELRGGLRAGPTASCASLADALRNAGIRSANHTRVTPAWFSPLLSQSIAGVIAARRAAAGAAEQQQQGLQARRVDAVPLRPNCT